MKTKQKWIGTWRNMTGPNGTKLRNSGCAWIIRDVEGKLVSKHDSREYALSKAKRFDKKARAK